MKNVNFLKDSEYRLWYNLLRKASKEGEKSPENWKCWLEILDSKEYSDHLDKMNKLYHTPL